MDVVVRNGWIHIFAHRTSTLGWPGNFGLNERLGRHRRSQSDGRIRSNIGIVDGEAGSAVCPNRYPDARRVSSGRGRRARSGGGSGSGLGLFARVAGD